MTRLTLEVGREPRSTTCPHCGRETRSTAGFIYRDDDAYAVYFGSLAAHDDGPRAILAIGIGTCGPNQDNADLSAFLSLSTTATEVRFGFIDPLNSGWSGSTVLGVQLSADQARTHRMRSDFLTVAELIARDDPAVASNLS